MKNQIYTDPLDFMDNYKHASVLMAERIIAEYKLVLSERAVANLTASCILFTQMPAYRVSENTAIYDAEVLENEQFPPKSSPKLLRCFLLIYKRFWPSMALGAQAATPIDLQAMGWVLEGPKNRRVIKDQMWEGNWCKAEGRRISGFNSDAVIHDPKVINPQRKKEYIKHWEKRDGNRCDCCMGMTGDRRLEMEHRVPAIRCVEKGHPSATIMKDSPFDEIDVDFQVFCRRCNSRKRENCKRCLATGEIRLDPLIKKHQPGVWPTRYTGTCVGCYWYGEQHEPHEPQTSKMDDLEDLLGDN